MQVGLGLVLELVNELLQYMQNLLVAMVYRVENVRETVLTGIRSQALVLAELRPVRQIRELPAQIQQVLRDLQELSKILLQLVINTTPLYNMVRNRTQQNPPTSAPGRQQLEHSRSFTEVNNSITTCVGVHSCSDPPIRTLRTS